MTADQNNLIKLESSLRSTREENELLFRQLHQVQDELELLYSKNQELERARPAKPQSSDALGKGWIDNELLDALAEIQQLRALVDVQRKIHRLESQNALNSRVGDILIHGVDSPASLLSAPRKLGRIWRESGRREPPKSLGGKTFDKVIAAYGKDGFDAAEALISSVSATPAVQANAYTALARQLIDKDRANAAKAARRAHALDPKPYRLKWLAFRLHENGEVIEAEAMLDSLPSDMQFSDSEARQASQLRSEARQSRQLQAKQQTRFSEKRAEVEKRLSDLARERDNQARLASEHGREIEALKHAKIRLELEKTALLGQKEDTVKLVAERDREIETLKRINEQRELDKSALAQQWENAVKLVAERDHEIETLTHARGELELEKAALLRQQAEAAKLIAERSQEIEALKQIRNQLELEKSALLEQGALAAKLIDERGQKIETLTQIKGQLELEKAELVIRGESLQAELSTLAKIRDEQIAVASQRQGELLQLARNQTALEKEKLSLELRQRELERQLEQVMRAHDEQTKLVAQRVQDLAVTFTERNNSVEGLLKKQSDDLIQARKYLDTLFRDEVGNSTRQIQALIGLQSYHATGDLPAVNSERHSWPISQDFALYLVELIELNDYDLVIEFGSGISTVVVAKALARASLRRPGRPAARFVSFEHLDQYYQQTYSRLVQAGLLDSVELVRAPLQDWVAPNGSTYPYYSCQNEFDKLAQKYTETGLRLLAIVDGPPASTGRHARYPAVPLLLQHFAKTHIDIVLDDYIRDDEKEIAKIWQAEVQSAGRTSKFTVRKLEKDACLIATSPVINR